LTLSIVDEKGTQYKLKFNSNEEKLAWMAAIK